MCGFVRSADFWFDDGSIVLVVQNTGFRVYHALLATRSTVFSESDMFASSTPNAQQMFKECPVVHLSECAVDVAHFLRVLLPTSHRTLFSPDYDIQDVLDQAIASLEDFFSSDFDTWDTDKNQVVRVTLRQSIGVVNLARLVDKPSLLPISFYRCMMLGSDVLDGYTRADGSVQHLHPEDLKRCIRGRNRLAEEGVGVVADIFVADPCGTCTTPDGCRNALKWMLESAVSQPGCANAKVLRSWEETIGDWGEDHGLCAPCQEAAVARGVVVRRRLWNALRRIFDVKVEGWYSSGEGEDD